MKIKYCLMNKILEIKFVDISWILRTGGLLDLHKLCHWDWVLNLLVIRSRILRIDARSWSCCWCHDIQVRQHRWCLLSATTEKNRNVSLHCSSE